MCKVPLCFLGVQCALELSVQSVQSVIVLPQGLIQVNGLATLGTIFSRENPLLNEGVVSELPLVDQVLSKYSLEIWLEQCIALILYFQCAANTRFAGAALQVQQGHRCANTVCRCTLCRCSTSPPAKYICPGPLAQCYTL